MKKALYLTTILFLAACSPKPKDKAAQLADLQKQAADINSKIAKLQTQVGKKNSVKSTDVSIMTVAAVNFTNYVDLQGRIDAQDNVIGRQRAVE